MTCKTCNGPVASSQHVFAGCHRFKDDCIEYLKLRVAELQTISDIANRFRNQPSDTGLCDVIGPVAFVEKLIEHVEHLQAQVAQLQARVQQLEDKDAD